MTKWLSVLGGLIIVAALGLFGAAIVVAQRVTVGQTASDQASTELIASALSLAAATLLGSGITLIAILATLKHERAMEDRRRQDATREAAQDRYLDGQIELLERALMWFKTAKKDFGTLYGLCERHAFAGAHEKESVLAQAHAFASNLGTNHGLSSIERLQRLIDDATTADAIREADGLVRTWNELVVADVHTGDIDIRENWGESLTIFGRLAELSEFVEEQYFATVRQRWGEDDAVAELPERWRASGAVPDELKPGGRVRE